MCVTCDVVFHVENQNIIQLTSSLLEKILYMMSQTTTKLSSLESVICPFPDSDIFDNIHKASSYHIHMVVVP